MSYCDGCAKAEAEVETLRAENAELFGRTALERRRADNEKARAEKLEAALRASLAKVALDAAKRSDECDAAEARAEKLAAALREIADERTHWAELKGIAARTLAEGEGKE